MTAWLVNAFRYNTLNEKKGDENPDMEFSKEMFAILMAKQDAYSNATKELSNY